jgi:hypothetical protein
MTVYAWPVSDADAAYAIEAVEPAIRTLTDSSVSPLSGDIQTTALPGSRWAWTVHIPDQTWAERRRLWALLAALGGQQHRLSMFDASRPVPAGSIPLNGVTVSSSAAQFADSVTLATGAAGCTVKAGDWIKLGSTNSAQLVMAVADATADGGGVIVVSFRSLLRAAVAAGTSVVLDYPRGLFVLADPDLTGGKVVGDGFADPMVFELLEVFTP